MEKEKCRSDDHHASTAAFVLIRIWAHLREQQNEIERLHITITSSQQYHKTQIDPIFQLSCPDINCHLADSQIL